MKKGLVLLWISLLITQLAICQGGSTTYPKVIILDSDTLVAFTKNQTKNIQIMKISYDAALELCDSMRSIISRDSILIEAQSTTIQEKNKEISTGAKVLELSEERVKMKDEELTTEKKKSKVWKTVSSILVVVVIVLII